MVARQFDVRLSVGHQRGQAHLPNLELNTIELRYFVERLSSEHYGSIVVSSRLEGGLAPARGHHSLSCIPLDPPIR
jgi:hypothetical protein